MHAKPKPLCMCVQWWCEVNPATGKARPSVYDASLLPPNGAAVAGRFLAWFILEGAKGYKVRPLVPVPAYVSARPECMA
jgi:hypothetical protein